MTKHVVVLSCKMKQPEAQSCRLAAGTVLMTEKELKRLSKLEIIDILIAQDEEVEDLNEKVKDLKEQLQRSNDIIDKVLMRIRSVREEMQ